MDRRGSLTSILTIFVFLSISTTGISKADTADNVMRCQNSNVKLKCLNKSFILVITSVFYGRTQPGSIVCPSPPRSHLSDEIVCNRQQNDVSDEVKQMCNEKISCNFTVRKQTFGKDGCPSIFKYIIIDYKCVNSQKFKRHEAIKQPVIPTSSVVKTTSSVALSTPVMTSSSITSTVVIQPSSTSVLGVETINTVDQSDVPRSSSRSSTRLHIVSMTTISHTQPFPVSTISNLNLNTTKSSFPSITRDNSEEKRRLNGERGTMKLFRFLLTFYVIREEHIHKRTANSVLWFSFGILVGLFITIAVIVYYRVQQGKNVEKKRLCKAAYVKQKDYNDSCFIEEKVVLNPHKMDALEMESQLGESV